MSKQPVFRKPSGGIRNKRVTFKFENGKEVFSEDLNVAKELWELINGGHTIEKKNAYFAFGNKVVFLDRVDEMTFNLEGDEE